MADASSTAASSGDLPGGASAGESRVSVGESRVSAGAATTEEVSAASSAVRQALLSARAGEDSGSSRGVNRTNNKDESEQLKSHELTAMMSAGDMLDKTFDAAKLNAFIAEVNVIKKEDVKNYQDNVRLY